VTLAGRHSARQGSVTGKVVVLQLSGPRHASPGSATLNALSIMRARVQLAGAASQP
jgi:hypothetical protein